MAKSEPPLPRFVPAAMGCTTMVLAVFLLLMMPFIFVDVMRSALERLHLPPCLYFCGIFQVSQLYFPKLPTSGFSISR